MIVPVFSNTHLDQEIMKLEQFKEVLRSIVFLNCGGCCDMTTYWFYPQEEQVDFKVTAYIFDSHRPFNHNNILDDSKRVFCVDDGCKSFTECPTAQEMQEYMEFQQEEDDDDDDDDEDEDSEAENAQEGTDPVMNEEMHHEMEEAK